MPDSASSPLLDRLAAALQNDYEIVRLLGRGGMASVFLARERALNRLVALKVIDPELGEGPIFRARFQREAETVAQLQQRRYQAAKADTSKAPVHVAAMARTAEGLGRLQEAIDFYSRMDTLRYTATVHAGPDADWLLLVRSYAARAAVYEALGDRERARAFYRRFLMMWDEPDSILVPERDRARRALAELERGDRGDRP